MEFAVELIGRCGIKAGIAIDDVLDVLSEYGLPSNVASYKDEYLLGVPLQHVLRRFVAVVSSVARSAGVIQHVVIIPTELVLGYVDCTNEVFLFVASTFVVVIRYVQRGTEPVHIKVLSQLCRAHEFRLVWMVHVLV